MSAARFKSRDDYFGKNSGLAERVIASKPSTAKPARRRGVESSIPAALLRVHFCKTVDRFEIEGRGRYRKGEYPLDDALRSHLDGEATVLVNPLSAAGEAAFSVVRFDLSGEMDLPFSKARQYADELQNFGIPSLIEVAEGGKGHYHVWVFHEEPLPAWPFSEALIRLGRRLFGVVLETVPSVRGEEYIPLPLQGESVLLQRRVFVNAVGKMIKDQGTVLQSLEYSPRSRAEAFVAEMEQSSRPSPAVLPSSPDSSKAQVSPADVPIIPPVKAAVPSTAFPTEKPAPRPVESGKKPPVPPVEKLPVPEATRHPVVSAATEPEVIIAVSGPEKALPSDTEPVTPADTTALDMPPEPSAAAVANALTPEPGSAASGMGVPESQVIPAMIPEQLEASISAPTVETGRDIPEIEMEAVTAIPTEAGVPFLETTPEAVSEPDTDDTGASADIPEPSAGIGVETPVPSPVMMTLLVFVRHGVQFALEAGEVARILTTTAMAPSSVPGGVCGTLEWDGTGITVLDPAVLAGQGASTIPPRGRVILLGGSLNGYGLLADSAAGTTTVSAETVLPPEGETHVRGIVADSGADRLLLIDAAGMTGARGVTQVRKTLPSVPSKISGQYVFFSIENRQYGLPASVVREILPGGASQSARTVSYRGRDLRLIEPSNRDVPGGAAVTPVRRKRILVLGDSAARAGLAVESVGPVRDVTAELIGSIPEGTSAGLPVTGIARFGETGTSALLLDPLRILEPVS